MSANVSLPKITDGLPPDLAASITEAEGLLSEHAERLAQLHDADEELRDLLPRRLSLAKQGLADDVAALDMKRKSAAVKKHGTLHAIAEAEPQLRELRERVSRELAGYGHTVAAEFEQRYAAAILTLQTLWLEAESLEKHLRLPIDVPPPVKLATDVKPDAHMFPWPPDLTGRHWIEPILPAGIAPPALSAEVLHVGRVLDGLDEALRFAGGVMDLARRVDEMALRPKPDGFDASAVYRTREGVVDPLTGEKLPAGMLVDGLVIPAPLLAREVVGRRVFRNVEV
jgi:hypothetical protein